MWNLANPSPYRADARIMWDRDGAETLVVLTKATSFSDDSMALFTLTRRR